MGNQHYLREKISHSYPKIAGYQKQIFHLNKGLKLSLKRSMSSILSKTVQFKLKIILKTIKIWTLLRKICQEFFK